MGALITAPAAPTADMIAAGNQHLTAGAAAVWSAMVAACPGRNAAGMVARLPTSGVNHRNPDFWDDVEVRSIVIEQHRQVTIKQLQAIIADKYGSERVPSKSALARVWKRLDRATVKPGYSRRVR